MNLGERLENLFTEYLNVRKALGYDGQSKHSARDFIKYCSANHSDVETVTKEVFDAWFLQREFKTSSYRQNALTNTRMFLRYICSTGESVFVPGDDYSVKVERFVPYIFTDEELTNLFAAFDTFPNDNNMPSKKYIVPVLFRMMYCCGMRPVEPALILKDEFDLRSGELYIRQSKGYKDRRILVSSDVLELCRKYAMLNPGEKYFFERRPGEQIPRHWIDNQFSMAWKLSGLPKRAGSPRPYDLRHNFTTRTIMRWAHEGRDPMQLMPFLSAYLGHTHLQFTYYYVHLVPERLFSNAGIDWTRLKSVYAEDLNG